MNGTVSNCVAERAAFYQNTLDAHLWASVALGGILGGFQAARAFWGNPVYWRGPLAEKARHGASLIGRGTLVGALAGGSFDLTVSNLSPLFNQGIKFRKL